MFSILRPSLLYTDISPDIAEHDEDHDAAEWAYSDRTVFRGALDVSYKNEGLDVYWLYDDDLNRVGLAEHESDDHSVFKTLWFRDSPFGTLLQEDWKAGESIFTMLSSEAYQDCVDSDILLKGSHRIITPKYITNGLPEIYECSCGKSFSPMCSAVKKVVEITYPLFIDDSFIMYQPPPDSKVWSRLGLLHDASVQKQEPPQQEQTPLLEPPLLETPAQE
jgi:hypothetical protein